MASQNRTFNLSWQVIYAVVTTLLLIILIIGTAWTLNRQSATNEQLDSITSDTRDMSASLSEINSNIKDATTTNSTSTQQVCKLYSAC